MTDEERSDIAEAIDGLARATGRLGTGNATTDMGAIEALAVKVGEAGEAIERGLADVADAIREKGKG